MLNQFESNKMSNLRKLRDYQQRINKKVKLFLQDPLATRGQVYSPTGSGKTECFGHTIHDLPQILKNVNRKKLNICIVHPRIALSQEQLKRFKDVFGAKYHYTSFHSGAHVKGTEAIQEVNTLSADDLGKIIDQDTRSHITFSSYDSFAKIANIDFDLLILDEAHNLTQNQYREALIAIAAKKAIFYTATPIIQELEDDNDASRGMNNESLFGKLIASIEPKELILRGFIVPPLLHFLRANTDKSNENVATVDVIAESFIQQRVEMVKHGMPAVQMLVATRGYNDHSDIEENLQALWAKIGQVPVYIIEANDARRNGHTYLGGNRFKVLEEIKNSDEDCIVMHYDTLSEGIDISSLTGACILRQLSKAKLLQTIGRCGRPYVKDLNSKFEISDMNKRMKPYCVITFPVIDGKHIGGIETKSICDAFTAGGYGDLSTYLSEDEQLILAKPENTLDLGDEDNLPHLAAILNSSIQRDAEAVAKLGFVF